MSGEWPMFLMQCIVVLGFVGAFFVNHHGD